MKKSVLPATLAVLALAMDARAQVVVMGHPQSGDFFVVANEQAPRLKAMQRANARQPGGGWQILLASTRPGWGRAFCVRPPGGPMRYFVVEGKANYTEASKAAKAAAIAAGTRMPVASCGPGWNNRNVHPLDPEPEPERAAPDGSGSARATLKNARD